MFGNLFFINESDNVEEDLYGDLNEDEDCTVDSWRINRAFTVCAEGMHVTYTMKMVVMHPEKVIETIHVGEPHGHPCDNSCKEGYKSFDFKNAFLRDIGCSSDLGPEGLWKHFEEEVLRKHKCKAEVMGRHYSTLTDYCSVGKAHATTLGYEVCFGHYHVHVHNYDPSCGGYEFSTNTAQCGHEVCTPKRVWLPSHVADWIRSNGTVSHSQKD